MMCPVSVANEMSGLRGRGEVTSTPNRRLRMDGVISGPSFGAGHEDQRSNHTSDQRKDQLDPGCGDLGDVGQAVATVADTMGQVRLRRAIRPPNAAAKPETGGDGGCGSGAQTLPGEVLRSEREALRREAR